MTYIRDLSIKHKLNLIIMLITSVALVGALSVRLATGIATSRARIGRELAIMAETVATNSTAALTFKDQNYANESLEVFSLNKHVVQAGLYDADGKVFAKYIGQEARQS